MPQASEMRQDQTLKWDEIFHPARQIVGRDPPQVIANQSIASPRSVDLKRRPPKSRPAASSEGLLPRKKAARKDSAVHVSLSSYSLVKQPGPKRSLSGQAGKTVETPCLRPPIGTLVLFIRL